MNSIIILLVIRMLFLEVFFRVSNEAIVVVFLAGRVVAGGGLGDSRRVSPTPVRRCSSRSLRLWRLLARSRRCLAAWGRGWLHLQDQGRASCRSARKSFPKMSLDEFRERIMEW